MSLRLRPITIKEANRVVGRWHRHNRPTTGGLFAVSVVQEDAVVGVAIVARPVARLLDDGWTCEITRVCTNGVYNACSILYGACVRAAKALGYSRVVTYTLATESGASLRAAGFVLDAACPAGGWARPNRVRVDVDLFGNETKPLGDKVRWAWKRS